MAQNEWAVVSESPYNRPASSGWEVVNQNPIQEKQSAFRQVADIPLGIAKGAVQGVRMIADAFGAGTDTSKTIKSAETYLADLMSAQAKNDQQEISRIMKDAEDKGVLDQVKAGIKAFTVAPIDTLSSALGTAAPVIAGALGAKVLGAGALVSTGVSALTGAGMGAGTIKGSIYEETKDTLKKAGASEEEAERRAQLAQEYKGKNLDQILLGTVLGGAAAVGPLEKGAAGILARRILGKTGTEATESVAEQTAKGALRRRAEAGLLEAVPEAVQAGQEKVAQNIALQREGFDVPTFRGAAGAATLEAIAGGGLGATLGGGKPEVAKAPEPPAPRTGPLTPEEQAELDRQRAAAERPKTTEELLAGIQTGRPTTPEDITRIRDEHETAVIEGLLAQDVEMKRAADIAAQQREQQKQQLALESEAETIAGGISDIDTRVREGRIFARVQDLIDRNIPYASTAINDINQKFGVINEAPLTEDERARVENIMGMVNTFTNFVNLPVLAPRTVDQFAENQAMEALIKERTERGQTEPLRAAPPAPSPRIEEAPVSQGVGEGAALRPEGRVEPSVTEDRERVAPATAPVVPAPVEPTVAEAPAAPAPPPASVVPESKTATGQQAGWVLRNKETGEVVMETNDPAKVKALNTEKYEAVPIAQYLASLSKLQKPAETKAEAPAVEATAPKAAVTVEPAVETAPPKAEAPAAPAAPKQPAFVYRTAKGDQTQMRMFTEDETIEFNNISGQPQLVIRGKNIAGTEDDVVVVYHNNIDRRSNVYDAKDLQKLLDVDPQVVKAIQKWLASDASTITSNGQELAKTLSDFVEGSAAETPAAPKTEASAAPTPFMQLLQEYWGGTVTPAIKNYLDAFNSFGVDRLESSQIKPVGMTAREWVESFVSKQSTWDKGRKTGVTGIQALSTKNLWPTADGSGERLRKSMLEAVKALKNAPGSTSELMDQAFTEERKSLGKEQTKQLQDFQQTLRNLLNKFGLKDVGLNIEEGMRDAGSYSQQLIRIASDEANPIRTLRHEAIHALRELGFFTDAQWNSLSKMAKDKWIDQYLKQRNEQGRPLKAGEESRYDAYMREYNGDMEKITEEAVADAFADFDATKPPAGMLQALLKRMRDLFQSIKSALTKIESPEQIFGKVEEGKLKPGEKREGGERKSVGAEAPKFKEDLGSPSWLQEQIDYAKERGRDRWGVPYMGKTTGSFKGDISVPMSVLEKLRGQRGEQQAVREESLDYIRKNWDEVSKEPPYIEVAYNGEAWISEGNHRIMVAKEKGLDSLPVEIKYFDGGQKVDGPLKPEKLLDIRKSIGGVKAAAQKALQKQPVPEKGLSHVSQDLTKLAQPIFFPQNKTVIDRIDGMKDRFWQRLAQKTADQFRTIKEYSPTGYMQARLSKSVDGSLEGLLFHGQVFDDGGALNIKPKTKGMMDILKPIGTELDSYLMWVALNRESTLPDTKRSKIPNMDKLVARRAEFAAGELNGKPRVEVYQDVLRQMNQLNKSVLDIALAKGIINQEGYDKFSNDIYYIPFYKKMEEDGTTAGAQTASGLTSQYFSKELKGSEAPFGDLMENIVRNWSHILSASMKNAAAQTTINDAMKLQAAEPNLKAGLEMRDGVVYSTKSDKPIEAKFDEDGKQIYAEGELRPDLTTSGTGMAKIMVDGQPMYFKVTDELLMESISSIGYMGPKSKFLDVARGFKNMLQYGVTASPIFKVNNLIRDSVSALAVSDLKKSPVYNVMTGISLSKKDSPTYISALAGGAIFNFGSAYEGDQAKLIKRLIDQGVDGDTILDTKDKITKALKKTWDAYQHLGDRSEAANRLALYRQLRGPNNEGMSHLQASFMARDLLDFSMQGSWGTFRFLTQVVPFMNARIQGLYKLGRDGINPTVRVLYNATTGKEIDANDKIRAAQFATVTSAVMLASALLYLTFKDDEDYKKRDSWDRDNFWWFKIPSLDIAFRIPKPFEVGAFGTLVERTLEQILDEGAEGKQFGESLRRTLWDTFALNPMPQIFKPLSDIYANKDSFSGAPIESAGLERLSKPERLTDMTSPLGIAMSKLWSSIMPEKFEASPVQMDYAIKGYFGWLGAMASMSSTYAVMPFKEGEYPDARWLDRASLGLVRDLPAPQSAYVTAFYNSSKEISQAFADMRHYREMGDSEKVQELLEEKGDKIMLAKFYDKTAKNIANVRKQIQLITNDKNLDGAEKKEMIERMKLIMSDLAKQAEEVRKSMKP